jgi:aspartyl protease family protein
MAILTLPLYFGTYQILTRESVMDDNPQKPLGRGMMIAAVIVALLVLTLMFETMLNQRNPSRSPIITDGATVILNSDSSGHYVAEGFINNEPVTFLVDTGATMVSIPVSVANRLNLERGPAFTSVTANGNTTSYFTRLDSVRLGSIEMRDVRAGINTGMEMEEILLGMSFLKYLEFTQRGEQLELKAITH